MIPILAITAGEPAGIGPDLVIALANTKIDSAKLVYVGDPAILQERANLLGQEICLLPFSQETQPHQKPLTPAPSTRSSTTLYYVPVDCPGNPVAGQLSARHSAYVLQTLEAAVSLCESRHAHAIVTGPVQKSIINEAGIPFQGHTEWLRQRTQATQVIMLMANDSLRVALTTTHVPIAKVSELLTQKRLTDTITTVHASFQSLYGMPQPRIAVCGLNPHAGENGHMGREEIDVIEPVLNRLRKQGMQLMGPLAADTAFLPQQRALYDVCITHYHDQGLPVLKTLDFENTINISLGLPLIRTSVDHGTALTLAGKGTASDASFRRAIEAAAGFVKNHQRHSDRSSPHLPEPPYA